MPQWRKLHVKTIDSLDINEMPDDFTRVFWLLFPLVLDCEGRILDDTNFIRSKVFPLRHDVTNDMVAGALDFFESRNMITRYTVGNRQYLFATNFAKHQGDTSKEANSNYPSPDDSLLTNSGLTQDLLPRKYLLDADADADADAIVSLKQKTPSRDMFGVLMSVCNVHEVTDKFRGWANRQTKRLLAAGFSSADIRAFGEYWVSSDWRAQNTPMDYLKFGSKFDAWVSKGRPSADNGKAPPDDTDDDLSGWGPAPLPPDGSLWRGPND